jgi:cytochrome c551/c552
VVERLSVVRAVVACARPAAVAAAVAVASCPVLAAGSASAGVGVQAGVGVRPGVGGRASVGGQGLIESISCPSAGNCAVAGSFTSLNRHQVFVVTERRGVWGRAEVVTGPGGPLVSNGMNVSCSSAGNCGGGGAYATSEVASGFVVTEKNGVWGKAEQVRGLAALNGGDNPPSVGPVVCPSAGNCVAGGSYSPVAGRDINDALVVSEKNGIWGKAEEVPGLAALIPPRGSAGIGPITCTSARYCLGIGSYAGRSGAEVPFAVTDRNGTWGRARPIPGIAGYELGSLSWSSAGNCVAAGQYDVTVDRQAPFVIDLASGVWGAPILLSGLDSLPGGGASTAGLGSVSCPSAGNCTAAGGYVDQAGARQPFVSTEKNGVWGQAQVRPGLARLNIGKLAGATLVCRSAGNCSAAGTYSAAKPGVFHEQVFVSTEKNGVWGNATELPGFAALNRGNNTYGVLLSCGAPAYCSLAGSYFTAGGRYEPFVAIQENGIWGKAREVTGFH